MKLGIIGLPGSGKTTVFEALTQKFEDTGKKDENRIGAIYVPDERVDSLSKMYTPKKTTYAQVEYFLPGKGEQTILNRVRDCDAFIHVLRNFRVYGMDPPTALQDFRNMEQEMVLSDLVTVEKRLERLQLDEKRGKKPDQEELVLLEKCNEHLNQGVALRKFPELTEAKMLKGFAFLSAKPVLVLFNNEDEDEALPQIKNLTDQEHCMVIRAKLEQELAQMSDEESEDFLSEFNITAPATDRVISRSYELMGLISFFTVGDDEVKAWTIKKGIEALDAAGTIHTDMKKGFIRAEVIHFDDLMAAGSLAEARKHGTVRLEGKTYRVKDGDIITFRFNV